MLYKYDSKSIGDGITAVSDMIENTMAVTRLCADAAKDSPTPHVFLKCYAKAKDIVSSDTCNLRLSLALSKVLTRTYTLYFAIQKLKCMDFTNVFAEIPPYVGECIRVLCNTSELFGILCEKSGDTVYYAAARNLALSENESLTHVSRRLRFAVVQHHGRIFSALCELEMIYDCTEALKRGGDLCRAIDEPEMRALKDFIL